MEWSIFWSATMISIVSCYPNSENLQGVRRKKIILLPRNFHSWTKLALTGYNEVQRSLNSKSIPFWQLMNLSFTTLAEQCYGFQQKHCFFVCYSWSSSKRDSLGLQKFSYLSTWRWSACQVFFYYFTAEDFWEKLLDFNQAIAQK